MHDRSPFESSGAGSEHISAMSWHSTVETTFLLLLFASRLTILTRRCLVIWSVSSRLGTFPSNSCTLPLSVSVADLSMWGRLPTCQTNRMTTLCMFRTQENCKPKECDVRQPVFPAAGWIELTGPLAALAGHYAATMRKRRSAAALAAARSLGQFRTGFLKSIFMSSKIVENRLLEAFSFPTGADDTGCCSHTHPPSSARVTIH